MNADVTELLNKDNKTIMRSIIQRIATGPDMSKDITTEEARAGMRAILQGDIDDVQTALFLIALRMKRETDAENLGILDGIRDVCNTAIADVDEVLDLSDPYNGYNRSLPAAPFMPAVMAACGVPTISHGVETTGPKFGITYHRVLRAAGIKVDDSVDEAAARLSGDAGWAYVDQKAYCPALHDLTELRRTMVKRQAITTVEVLTRPISGKSKTHYMSGYVHKPYTRVYAMLARHAGYDSCLMVRGVEGGIIPSLRQPGKVFHYHDMGEEVAQDFDPATIGIDHDVRAAALPEDLPPKAAADDVGTDFDVLVASERAAEAGIAALEGHAGTPTSDALVYAGAIALWHLGRADSLQAGAEQVRDVLKNGSALERFNANRN